MKTAKLVIGIISIVLTFVVMFQSCAASIGDALANEGEPAEVLGYLLPFSCLSPEL
jgi:hypothetical protein